MRPPQAVRPLTRRIGGPAFVIALGGAGLTELPRRAPADTTAASTFTVYLGANPGAQSHDEERVYVAKACPPGTIRTGAPVPLNVNPPAWFKDPTMVPQPTLGQMISDCDAPTWATSDPADCSVVSGLWFPNDSGIDQYCKVSVSVEAGSSPLRTYAKRLHGGWDAGGTKKDIVVDPGVRGARTGCWAYADYGENTCMVDGWASPGDGRDLRCKVHVGANAFQSYECNVVIKYAPAPETPPPPPPPANAPGTLTVLKARIGCLPIQKDGNLTAIVAHACNGKKSCDYAAPTESQYKAAGVHAETRDACTQGMEIDYTCSDGREITASVPGDAWKHPPAALRCENEAPPAPKSVGRWTVSPPAARPAAGPPSSKCAAGLHAENVCAKPAGASRPVCREECVR